MNWLLSILKLIPYIAAGVHLIHADATVGERKKIASDLIGLSTAASQEVLSPENAQIAASVGAVAQNTVSNIIDVLHSQSATPVVSQ